MKPDHVLFTVTGTIAQECFFSDKPFGVFGPCITENFHNTYKLSNSDISVDFE